MKSVIIRLRIASDEADQPSSGAQAVCRKDSRKFGTQKDSYTFVIASAIRAIKSSATTSVSKVDRKDFVFIIDEINR